MKTLTPVPSLCALAFAACAQPVPRDLAPEDIAAIEGSETAFETAALAADFDAVAELYTEDGMLMPPNEDMVEGRAAIRDWFAGFPPLVALDLEPLEIEGVGDLAYVRGTYTLEFTADDATVTDRGKFLEIRREQEDGSWLIVADMFSSNLPPAPPPAPADSM